MAKVKIITAAEAAAQVPDGAVINTEGFVQAGLSETLNRALEQRFLETGHPKDLTIFTVAGQGAGAGTGSDHFAHEGMVKRLIAGHYNLAPTPYYGYRRQNRSIQSATGHYGSDDS